MPAHPRKKSPRRKSAKKKAATPRRQSPRKKSAQPLRLEYVEAGSLTPNPANWRRHPESQVKALAGVIGDDEVGWAGALLFNQRTGRLIDGHARRDLAIEREGAAAIVPVLIGDWSEAAEAKILATHDPIAGLADIDVAALESLRADIELDDDAFAGLNASLDAMMGDLAMDDEDEPAAEEEEEEDQAPEAGHELGAAYQVIITCDDEAHQQAVYELLKDHDPDIDARVVTVG